MILSMTGFGDAQLEEAGQFYHFEIRSVNNRYFKTTIRLPEAFGFLEPELESLLRQRMTRGSVTARMYVRDLSAAAAQEINPLALQRYIDQLRAAAGADMRLTIDLAVLAALPGVCQPRELSEQERAHCWSIVEKLANAALAKLMEMRAAEGRSLADDLGQHCERMRTHLAAIGARAPRVVEDYRARLTARVNELIAGSSVKLAEADLLKEVAIYAERSDIAEEISRLGGHLEQFAACIVSREPAGRKLEFISQEMLREANTIGSKANDAEIARHTIEIKSAIDRIKEQVQNAE